MESLCICVRYGILLDRNVTITFIGSRSVTHEWIVVYFIREIIHTWSLTIDK